MLVAQSAPLKEVARYALFPSVHFDSDQPDVAVLTDRELPRRSRPARHNLDPSQDFVPQGVSTEEDLESTEISAPVDLAVDNHLHQPMAAVVPTRCSAGGDRSVARDSLDALGMQLCFSVSYLSAIGPEIAFGQILAECGLELSTCDGGLLSRDVLAELAVEFGLAVVLDGMPPAGSILAILADLAAPFAVTVSVPAAHRLRAA